MRSCKRTSEKSQNANFAFKEFYEDEMRRPTPYAVPLGLQALCTGSKTPKLEGGSAHHGW